MVFLLRNSLLSIATSLYALAVFVRLSVYICWNFSISSIILNSSSDILQSIRAADIRLEIVLDLDIEFHNLRGYDSHLLMQAISKEGDEITCITNNIEKYILFSLNQLRFIERTHSLLASVDRGE